MDPLRYRVEHHPDLATFIYVEDKSGKKTQIESRYNLYASLSYCREGCLQNNVSANPEGVPGVYWGLFTQPERFVFVGPWITPA
jgi:hypothetical protein